MTWVDNQGRLVWSAPDGEDAPTDDGVKDGGEDGDDGGGQVDEVNGADESGRGPKVAGTDLSLIRNGGSPILGHHGSEMVTLRCPKMVGLCSRPCECGDEKQMVEAMMGDDAEIIMEVVEKTLEAYVEDKKEEKKIIRGKSRNRRIAGVISEAEKWLGRLQSGGECVDLVDLVSYMVGISEDDDSGGWRQA